MIMKIASWRTLVFGLLSGLSIIFAQISYVLDNDPKTSFSLVEVLAGIGFLGMGWNARDDGVTSRQSGAE